MPDFDYDAALSGPVRVVPTQDAESGVTYAITTDYEDDIDFRREFAHDPQTVRWIQRQINDGNEWAWCRVTVAAKWTHPETDEEFEGHDYLGGCSYRSEEDFKQPGGYYQQMCDGAFDDLADLVERSYS